MVIMADKWEEWRDVDIEELAMAAVLGDAEGLEPSFKEARKSTDLLKWDEAV